MSIRQGVRHRILIPKSLVQIQHAQIGILWPKVHRLEYSMVNHCQILAEFGCNS